MLDFGTTAREKATPASWQVLSCTFQAFLVRSEAGKEPECFEESTSANGVQFSPRLRIAGISSGLWEHARCVRFLLNC